MTRRRAMAGIGLLVAVAIVIGVAFLLRDMDSPPELDLHYPGSVEIERSDTRVTLGSNASAAEIAAFYRQEVAALGFQFGGGTAFIPTTVELFACAWHDDDQILRLAFLDREAIERRGQSFPGDYRTVYRWSAIPATADVLPRPCSIILEGDPQP
jgi:hypothetical protein